MSVSWRGREYDSALAVVHEQWAESLLTELAPRDGEAILDAGCGSGRFTLRLLEAAPRGRILAVDASQSMLDEARERIAAHPRAASVTLLRGDLTTFEAPFRVDAVFSSATFHWIHDHETLFQNLFRAM